MHVVVGGGWSPRRARGLCMDWVHGLTGDAALKRSQTNVFVIGTKATPVISLPRQKGIKHGIIEEARRRAEKASKN